MSINNEENDLFHLEDDEKEEEEEDNHLKCSICKQLLNQPKFLSCTHSFCLQCIEKLIENKDEITIECPLCQQITQVNQ
jgi:hypothetical protein